MQNLNLDASSSVSVTAKPSLTSEFGFETYVIFEFTTSEKRIGTFFKKAFLELMMLLACC